MTLKKITLKEIAEKLKVSKVTVSKALRNHPDISKEMIGKVNNTAKRMGYIPNKTASMLSSRKTNTIGLIVPKIAHSFFSTLIESIYEEARKRDYEIVLTSSMEDLELQDKHLKTMISMNVDGVLISVAKDTTSPYVYNLLKNNDIPIVEIDRTIDPSLSKIIFNDVEGSYRAISYAIEHGFKKIAFIGGNHKAHIGKHRLQGYKKALRKYGIPIDKKLILEGGFKEIDGYDSLMKFYNSGNIPEIIFAVTYPVALGVVSAAKELKLKIPRDIDLLSFGDSEFNKFISPAISCVNQDTEKIGKLAVSKIISEIEDEDINKPQTIVIESELLIKGTCKKRKVK